MNRKMLLTLSLLAVFILAACTPAATAPVSAPDSGAMEESAASVEESAPAQEESAPAAEPVAATEVPASGGPMAAPTSRGSQLVATDPSTVNLASGEPQLIEFFAFW